MRSHERLKSRSAGEDRRSSSPSAYAVSRKRRGAPENKTGLPTALKANLEHAAGIDLSDIRVHFNSPEPGLFSAHALAQGSDIHIAAGQAKHLAHEAWHVVQQKQGRVRPTARVRGLDWNGDSRFEREADLMGAWATRSHRELPARERMNRAGGLEPALPGTGVVQPKLVAKRRNPFIEGYVGEFARLKTYSLAGETGPGVIVQHVVRDHNIKDNTNTLMSSADVDTYVGQAKRSTWLATESEYWEAWPVADGDTVPQSDDRFGLVQISDDPSGNAGATVDKTSGTYQVSGRSTFHPYSTDLEVTKALQADGFTTTAVNNANGLDATLSAPAKLSNATSVVDHVVKATWNRTLEDKNNRGWFAPTKVAKNTIS